MVRLRKHKHCNALLHGIIHGPAYSTLLHDTGSLSLQQFSYLEQKHVSVDLAICFVFIKYFNKYNMEFLAFAQLCLPDVFQPGFQV